MTSSVRPNSAKARLARNLREARKRADIGQTAAAEQLKVSRQTLIGWEREDDKSPWPDEAAIERMAKLYGTDPQLLRYAETERSLIRAAYIGEDAARLTEEERIALSEMQLQIVRDFKGSDPLVRAAYQLAQVPEGPAFFAAARGATQAEPLDELLAIKSLAWFAIRVLMRLNGKGKAASGARRGSRYEEPPIAASQVAEHRRHKGA